MCHTFSYLKRISNSPKRTFVHIICLVSYFPKELSIKEYTRQYMIFTQSVFSNFMLQCWSNNIRDTRSIFMYINKVSEQASAVKNFQFIIIYISIVIADT